MVRRVPRLLPNWLVRSDNVTYVKILQGKSCLVPTIRFSIRRFKYLFLADRHPSSGADYSHSSCIIINSGPQFGEGARDLFCSQVGQHL